MAPSLDYNQIEQVFFTYKKLLTIFKQNSDLTTI